MTPLHRDAHELLRLIIATGDAGLPIPANRLGDLASLISEDFVRSPPITEPRVAWATEKGIAYSLRTALA